MTENMRYIQTTLDNDIYRQFRDICASKDTKMTKVLRELIAQFVAENKEVLP